jgi:hypothetical protein
MAIRKTRSLVGKTRTTASTSRRPYEPNFSLIGVLKRLDSPAQAAILEAERLDDQEAPQRDAARLASEQEAARDKLEKARLENKPRFRP